MNICIFVQSERYNLKLIQSRTSCTLNLVPIFIYYRFLIYLNLWKLLHHREIKHDFVTIIVDREILLQSFVRAKKLFLLNFWISTSTEVVGREVFAHPSCQGWHDISRILIHQKFTKCWLTAHSSAGSLT